MRGYIETLLKMPWDKVSRDNQNIEKAKDVLANDHYGLEKVKERILEFLAVRTPDEERGKSHFVPDRTAGYRKDFHRSFCC